MKTVVVAEDFQTSRKVIVNVLSKKGYKVFEAEDGAQALDIFDGRSIDLLVTDYNMPRMDGAELVTAIRKIEQYKFMPALVLSTEIKQEKKEKASAAKITAWIAKPFDLERFIKIVEKSLR